MPTQEEKTGFAQRLRIALDQLALQRGKVVKGAASLARQFNLRHPGAMGISSQAAHKWLTGGVMPTTDKIKTLAQWLGVTEHWLHYGPPPTEKMPESSAPITSKTRLLGARIQALSMHQQHLIKEVIKQFDQGIAG